jgi:hypothetical protein
MRRIRALSIPLLVAVLLLAVVITVEAQRTPEWREALNQYVHQVNTTQSGSLQVLRVVKASLPWNFRADWGLIGLDYGRFGAGVAQPARAGEKAYSTHRSLPYPPQTVHCVLLRAGTVERVIFVNFHSDDLWQYGWVILEGARRPFPAEFVQRLAEIGCTF